MSKENIEILLSMCLKEVGSQKVEEALKKLVMDLESDDQGVLTIVANYGVHRMPDYLRRGELYILSSGSLDFSSRDSVEGEFKKCLAGLAVKLKSRAWKRIYLVPFGPTLLSALAKLLVFRITGIETIDSMHLGAGDYVDVDIDIRDLILQGGEV